MKLIFTIYGFGEVGSLLASLINSNFSNCCINIIDPDDSKSGRMLDFEHAATCNGNTVHSNSKDTIIDSDFILYAAGIGNLKGEDRNSVASKNKQLVYELFSGLKIKRSCKIIVITNPVEPISYWVNDALNAKFNVIGTGTSLDTFRFQFILSKFYKCNALNIETRVIGEHGKHMVPLFSETRLNGINLLDFATKKDLPLLTNELIDSAVKIRETENATKYGISQTTLELIQAFNQKSETIIPISVVMPEHLQKEYNCSKPIYISLACKINMDQIQVEPLKLTEDERLAFQKAVNSIEKIITETT